MGVPSCSSSSSAAGARLSGVVSDVRNGAGVRIIVLGGGSTTVTIASGEENTYIVWARSGLCIFFTFVGILACYSLLFLYCVVLILLYIRTRNFRSCGCAGDSFEPI